MNLQEMYDKIGEIIKENPSWANCDRIGVVRDVEKDTGWKDMEWCVDVKTICCDGQGIAAIQLELEDDKYFLGDLS